MKHDELADVVKAQYQLFLGAIQGAYGTAVMAGANVSPRMLTITRDTMLRCRSTMLGLVRQVVDIRLLELHAESSNAKLLSEIAQAADDALTEVDRIALTAVNEAMRLLRGREVAAREAGSLSALKTRRADALSSKATDRGGKIWDAATLARSYVRSWAYRSALLTTLDRSNGVFELFYPNPSHEHHGLRFVKRKGDGPEDFPSLKEIEHILHPNSTSVVRPYVSA